MAFGGRKGGDVVLESRHVIGVFLLIVVISGVVFTLGYLLGRSQYDPQHRVAGNEAAGAGSGASAAKSAAQSAKAQPAESAPAPADWGFYRAAETNKPGGNKTEKGSRAESKSATPAKPAAKPAAAKGDTLLNAPLIPRGAILLQVAALTRQSDALALAEDLQQKKFPAFVLTPGADHYYRVQVGPYADPRSADMAKRALENEGFKSIVKR